MREWSWLTLRPDISSEIKGVIHLLTPWTAGPSANLHRFATESTRPRGVWHPYIEALKQDAEPARPLLEPLKAEPSQYVQDSVASWLNDASKYQPNLVRELCADWIADGVSKRTDRIVKRATRSLQKA